MSTHEGIPWLRELGPWDPLVRRHPTCSPHLSRRVAAVLGAEALSWGLDAGAHVAARMVARVPGHRADDGVAVLQMGTESVVLRLLLLLAGQVEADPSADADAQAGVIDFIQRRLSLDEVLRAALIGQSVITEVLMAACARLAPPPRIPADMQVLSAAIFDFFEVFSATLARTYAEEETRWARQDLASRVQVVDDVLAGHDVSASAASATLRYQLERTHVGFVAWSTERTVETERDRTADEMRQLLSASGFQRHLVLPSNVGVVWGWVATDDDVALLQRLRRSGVPPRLRVALGAPGTGVQGFVQTHQDAEAAFATVAARSDAPTVIGHQETVVPSLLLDDEARAHRFALRELGALAGDQPQLVELRRTVAAYLDSGGSPQTAAGELSVSRNTVTYRLRSAEDLLGRSVGERRFALRCALAVLDELDLRR